MVIDYNLQKTFMNSIDLVDIGNFTIRCSSEDNLDYYMIAKTIMGKTAILKFGPVCPDLPTPLDTYEVNYKVIDYREKSICKEVTLLINDQKKKINKIEELVELEALTNLIDFNPVFLQGEF